MGGALRKTMVYLGLAEDEERFDAYEFEGPMSDLSDHDDSIDDLIEDRDGHRESQREVEHLDDRRAAVTPISRGQLSRAPSVAAPKADLQRISTIHPRTYSEAKVIGEAFRSGIPVIMNLGDMDDADAKRLVDFAAGLAFGLHGAIERVTSKVFLLSPAHVEVAPAEKIRAPERSFFNQV
jgi:cell division inhibitor SepF